MTFLCTENPPKTLRPNVGVMSRRIKNIRPRCQRLEEHLSSQRVYVGGVLGNGRATQEAPETCAGAAGIRYAGGTSFTV
jgi:hypothetical protein